MMLRVMVLMRARAKQVIVMVLNPTDLRCKSPPLVGEVRYRECRLFCGRSCKLPPLVWEVRLNRWFRFWELPPPTGFLLVLFHHTIVVCVLSLTICVTYPS